MCATTLSAETVVRLHKTLIRLPVRSGCCMHLARDGGNLVCPVSVCRIDCVCDYIERRNRSLSSLNADKTIREKKKNCSKESKILEG